MPASLPEQQSSRADEHVEASPRWNVVTRTAFRFGFIYWLLYSMPVPGIYQYRFVDRDGLATLWHSVVPWFASRFLHHNLTVVGFQGAGDSLYNYDRAFLFVLLAAAGTAVWSLAARRTYSHPKLHAWLRLFLRLGLGAAMFDYGVAKLLPGQYAATPSTAELLRTYGDSSPMGLLWTFMAAGRPYAFFAGLIEAVGGILLFVPRLATLGALISAASLTNVFMLNMSYDVPVKLYTLHLLFKSLFILAPDTPRLAAVLALNRRVEPANRTPLFGRQLLNRAMLAFQVLFGVWIVVGSYTAHLVDVDYRASAKDTPFRGVWFVDEFVVDGQNRLPLVTDQSCWARVVFDLPDRTAIQLSNGGLRRFVTRRDSGRDTVQLRDIDDPKSTATFSLSTAEHGVLMMDGVLSDHKIHARMHLDDKTFLLLTRGFHWVNRGFNR